MILIIILSLYTRLLHKVGYHHLPSSISYQLYRSIQYNKHLYPPHLVGFVGFGCSYSGRFFQGYARDSANKRNYCLESRNNILKQLPYLSNISIHNVDYRKLFIPPHSIVYCDPPYANSKRYETVFDHSAFYLWCRKVVQCGCYLYVSEYSMPPDFECVWEQSVHSSLTADTSAMQATERLWIHSSQL